MTLRLFGRSVKPAAVRTLTVAGLAVVVCLSLAPREASAVLLSDLVSSQRGITSGDKLFDNFSVTVTPNASGFYVMDPSAIDVKAKQYGNDYGIELSGPMSASADAAVVLLLEFDATVTDPKMVLHDIGLSFNGVATSPQGIASVTETIFLPGTNTVVGQAYVATPSPLSDLVILSSVPGTALRKVHVVKDIKLIGGPDGVSGISYIRQSFSQVPEPSSLIALCTGIIGLLGLRRRKR